MILQLVVGILDELGQRRGEGPGTDRNGLARRQGYFAALRDVRDQLELAETQGLSPMVGSWEIAVCPRCRRVLELTGKGTDEAWCYGRAPEARHERANPVWIEVVGMDALFRETVIERSSQELGLRAQVVGLVVRSAVRGALGLSGER